MWTLDIPTAKEPAAQWRSPPRRHGYFCVRDPPKRSQLGPRLRSLGGTVSPLTQEEELAMPIRGLGRNNSETHR